MEIFDSSLNDAKKKIIAADHLVNVTFNLINDGKVIISAIENAYEAIMFAMDSILYLEEYYKEIDVIPATPEEKFNIFKIAVVNKFNIEKEMLELIKKLMIYHLSHKNSPVEFTKEGNFVICDDKYNTKIINITEAKDIISLSKKFINKADTILRGRDVIYRRRKK